MRITDFHTHAFPDAIAERAMQTLLAETENVTAFHDGRLCSLISSMDRAGIARSVICSIATKPNQFEKILSWSHAIRSERIIPFPSLHPLDDDVRSRVSTIAAEGFKGIKLHPYYQDFNLDDESLFPLYDALCENNLILVSHTGFDVAFPRIRKADPRRIMAVVARFPDLKLVTTHLGSWEDWDEAAHIIGKPVYLEISYSLCILARERARQLLRAHPSEYILFGTDSPWQDQRDALAQLRELEMGPDWERAVLSENAARLLD